MAISEAQKKAQAAYNSFVTAKSKPVSKAKQGFFAQMTESAYSKEATEQKNVDTALFKRLKQAGNNTVSINKELKPEKVSIPKEALKKTGAIFADFGKGMLKTLGNTTRASTQLLATPVAGAFATAPGGVTPKQAMAESLKMSKDLILQKTDPNEAIDKAAQMWLENRGVGKYGGKEPDIADFAALSAIKIFDLIGDPLLSGAFIKGAKAAKESLLFKKVGKVTEKLPEGTSFVKGTTREAEIVLTPDLKIKVKPMDDSIVLQGYKRRFGSQALKSEKEMAPETADMIMELRKTTGREISAKFVGDDLIISPKAPIVNPSRLLEAPKETISQPSAPARGLFEEVRKTEMVKENPQTIAGVVEEARKYKSAEEFVKSPNIEYHFSNDPNLKIGDTIKTTHQDGVFTTKSPHTWATQLNYERGAKAPQELYITEVKNPATGENAFTSYGHETVSPQGEVKIIGKIGNIEEMFGDRPISISKVESIKQSQLTDIWNKAKKDIIEPPSTKPPKELPQTSEVISKGRDVEPEFTPIMKPAGGGEKMKTSRLSKRVEEAAIEKELTEGFGELPEFQTANMADQAKKATQIIADDPEQAVRIALGYENAPEGVIPESVFVAVEKAAFENGDFELVRQLAKSQLSTEATAMGQRIRALGERNVNSPVDAMREVAEARAAAFEKKTKTKPKTAKRIEANKIREEIKKTRPKRESWEDFINSIECK